ncbi:YigZ family protein [uncultured Corynebacterium sp.]|uniref:IMPACT family protein n=1 Tax=uncultured Corynebacterium sp. TaxID=159447 RepID=UPI0025DABCC6|nr:YigZ family protein [uncultured Corynebacterium sp.]
MADGAYRRPAAGTVRDTTIEVKRSRFLALVTRAATEEDARAFITRTRADHPDARHHCSAFILHIDGANPVERSSDDGEPSGTAGQPMLEVLRGSGLHDVVVVVVRWFGGVKLGTGGLVRAYGDATREVLDGLPVVRREQRVLWTLSASHADAGRLAADLHNRGMDVTASYGADVTLTLALSPDTDPTGTVAGLTGGTVTVRRTGEQWCDVPVAPTAR